MFCCRKNSPRDRTRILCVLQIRLLLLVAIKAKANLSQNLTGANGAKKAHKSEEKKEKKVRCNYCKELGHMIKDCPKVAAKEERKKEAGMVVVDTSKSNAESANVVQESEWAFDVQCSYDPSLHDVCMSVLQIHMYGILTVVLLSTLLRSVTCLLALSLCCSATTAASSVTCANNSEYPVRGVRKIVL